MQAPSILRCSPYERMNDLVLGPVKKPSMALQSRSSISCPISAEYTTFRMVRRSKAAVSLRDRDSVAPRNTASTRIKKQRLGRPGRPNRSQLKVCSIRASGHRMFGVGDASHPLPESLADMHAGARETASSKQGHLHLRVHRLARAPLGEESAAVARRDGHPICPASRTPLWTSFLLQL